MPNKMINFLLRSILVFVFLFSVSSLSISAEEPKNDLQTTIQIYYSGAQSGYIEPCG